MDILKLIYSVFTNLYIINSLLLLTILIYTYFIYLENDKMKRLISSKFRECQNIRKRKQREREKKLEELRELYKMDGEFQEIISLSFEDLIKNLQTRKLSATHVLKAYMAKAIDSTDKFNSITEFNPKAFEMAKELDALKEIKGPFHGVPVCIKDDFDVEGMDTTLGLTKNLFKPAKTSSVMVQTLLDLGAIPFCKTNVPQTLCSSGSHNPIFGKTLNPLNIKCGPGGSSSGTASLVASGGVLFGLGSDLGGSVRIPAHCCGISGIKVTRGRLSNKGQAQALPSAEITGVPGILAKKADTVAQVFKALTEENRQNEKDPLIPSISWDNKLFQSKTPLRIGFWTSQELFPCFGDAGKIILQAKEYLESRGHTLIPFEVPLNWHIVKTFIDIISCDLGAHVKEQLKYDEISESIKNLGENVKIPVWRRKITNFLTKCDILPLYRDCSDREKLSIFAGFDAEKSKDLWKAMGKRQNIIQKFLVQMEEKNLDCLIGPTWPFPAIKLDDASKFLSILKNNKRIFLINF